jgi:hypothetical protein
MTIDAPNIGVTIANILIVRKSAILIKGNNIRLFRNPGIPNVLLVINKLVKPTVELIPAKITPSINIS